MSFYSFFLHLAIFEYFNDTLIHSLWLVTGWVLMSFVGGSCQDCSMGSLLNRALVANCGCEYIIGWWLFTRDSSASKTYTRMPLLWKPRHSKARSTVLRFALLNMHVLLFFSNGRALVFKNIIFLCAYIRLFTCVYVSCSPLQTWEEVLAPGGLTYENGRRLI